MRVYLGADHRAFELKEQIKEWLQKSGHSVVDCGNEEYDARDDYVDFGVCVARRVAEERHENPDPESIVGIVLCGSGIGMSIAANRIRGVRCALCVDPEHAAHARENDHANVLSLASERTDLTEAKEIIAAFFKTPPKKIEKYLRRSQKLDSIK